MIQLGYPLVMTNIAMENGPFLADLWWFTYEKWCFSIATLNNQIVHSGTFQNLGVNHIPMKHSESPVDNHSWVKASKLSHRFMDKTWSNSLTGTPTGWWFGTWLLWLSIYWECHHPNWRAHIFQSGRYTTNQIRFRNWSSWDTTIGLHGSHEHHPNRLPPKDCLDYL